jgi:hypothetical protein
MTDAPTNTEESIDPGWKRLLRLYPNLLFQRALAVKVMTDLGRPVQDNLDEFMMLLPDEAAREEFLKHYIADVLEDESVRTVKY